MVHQQGGITGIERELVVQDQFVTVRQDGAPYRRVELAPAERDRLEALAAKVAAVSDQVTRDEDEVASDVIENCIAIDLDGAEPPETFTVTSIDEAPDVVWELLTVLSDLAEGS